MCCVCPPVWLPSISPVSALSCSWSNEGCSTDSDCCSRSCWRAHEGTNPRCRHSTLGEPCVFDYHCGDDLVCGQKHYNCCSPYWKMCTKDSDCCEPDHVCRPVEGFIYDRCLYPSAAGRPRLFFLRGGNSFFVGTVLSAVVAWAVTVCVVGWLR